MEQETQNQVTPKHHKSRQHGYEIWLLAFFFRKIMLPRAVHPVNSSWPLSTTWT